MNAEMNKNILSFIIPLVIVLLIGFTSISDSSFLYNFKSKINIEYIKLSQLIKDSEKTEDILKDNLVKNKNEYLRILRANFKDERAITHIMNYLYYLNERSISWVYFSTVEGDDNKKSWTNKIFKYNHLMSLEYMEVSKYLSTDKERDFVLINIYKEMSKLNRNISEFTYGYILKVKDTYSGEFLDGSEAVTNTIIF